VTDAIVLRPLRLTDAPALLALMRRAEGGLGRLPDEMDLPWMEDDDGSGDAARTRPSFIDNTALRAEINLRPRRVPCAFVVSFVMNQPAPASPRPVA
jgi:hypothetical protein